MAAYCAYAPYLLEVAMQCRRVHMCTGEKWCEFDLAPHAGYEARPCVQTPNLSPEPGSGHARVIALLSSSLVDSSQDP